MISDHRRASYVSPRIKLRVKTIDFLLAIDDFQHLVADHRDRLRRGGGVPYVENITKNSPEMERSRAVHNPIYQELCTTPKTRKVTAI